MKKQHLLLLVSLFIGHYAFAQQDTLIEKVLNDTISKQEVNILPLWNLSQLNTYKTSVFDIGNGSFFNDGVSINNVFYIDDIIMPANAYFPKFAIKNYNIKTNYFSPRYNDTYNSMIGITTNSDKDSSFFNIGVNLGLTKAMVNSAEVNFDYNLPTKNLFKKWKQAPVFYFAGNFFTAKDANPSYISIPVATDETLTDLQNEPYVLSSNIFSLTSSSEYLQKDDFTEVKLKQNANANSTNLYAKLVFPISKNIDITLGNYSMFQKGKAFVWENALYNSQNNPEVFTRNINTYLKFEHQFINGKDFSAKYTANISYYSTYKRQQDENHQDNYWDYGYIGKYKTYKMPSFEFTDTVSGYPSGIWMQNGYMDTLVTFSAGTENAGAANYTNAVYNFADTLASGNFIKRNKTLLQQFGAILNGHSPKPTYGLWNSLGTQNSLYSKENLNVYRFDINFDFKYKNHKLNIGYIFDKSNYSYYQLDATSLWVRANQLANKHLYELDYSNPIVSGDTLYYNSLYNADNQSFFDKNLRQALGFAVDGTDWIDVDNYSPETFKLEYFSPDELLNDGGSLVNYAGYDVYGNKISSNDYFGFFTKKDANNVNYLREIPAYQPYTMNPYFNYSFAHKYFKINAGLAMNYFNANQPVLSDPYTFHKIKTAGEATEFSHPSNIGDDYTVYVDNYNNPINVLGYRHNDQWYNANGKEIDNYKQIEAGTGLTPYLVDADFQYKNVNTNAFEMYKAQTKFLPQIEATIFPIKYIALNGGYVSHTKNPSPYISMYNPTNYLFADRRWLITNPNLSPEKTSKWFVGLTHYTRFYDIGFSYSETSFDNVIVFKEFEGVYPNNYATFINDADTTYKLNKINIKLNIYTPNHSINIGTNLSFYSDLDTILPFLSSPDFVANNYITVNLTTMFRAETLHKITKHLSVSLTNSIQNGRYYIAYDNANVEKNKYDISYFNLKISKSFFFKNNSMIGIYIDIYNLFNSKIVNSVYSQTGEPDDDGYLSDSHNQININGSVNPESYKYQYSLYANNPYNYGMPRIVKIGVNYKF